MMLKRAVPVLFIALAVLLAWAFVESQRSVRDVLPPSRVLPPPSAAEVAAAFGRRAGDQVIELNAAPPRRIQIPAIGVSADVIPLGLNPDGTIQTPKAWGVAGWYKPGPAPGERGPAVVVGHMDSKSGPAVFYRLRALRPGDVIRIVRRDGSSVRFGVRRLERWPKSDFPTGRVYGSTHGAALRLVTCGGAFNFATDHYLDNTIVYASRI